MNIGIICSAGGSTFIELYDILNKLCYKNNFFVITDRECNIEKSCETRNISFKRVESIDNREFSIIAKNIFKDNLNSIDFILLLFTRLVTKELFTTFATYNLHPSILPAYPGINGVNKMLKSASNFESRFLGCTLHMVDDSIDNGMIVAQTITPNKVSYEEKDILKVLFLHKIYLSLLLFSLYSKNSIRVNLHSSKVILDKNLKYTCFANPLLDDLDIIREFDLLQQKEGIIALYE